jgi:hypothetical protein
VEVALDPLRLVWGLEGAFEGVLAPGNFLPFFCHLKKVEIPGSNFGETIEKMAHKESEPVQVLGDAVRFFFLTFGVFFFLQVHDPCG